MHIGEALQMQIEVQRRLHEQLEVQKQHNISYMYLLQESLLHPLA